MWKPLLFFPAMRLSYINFGSQCQCQCHCNCFFSNLCKCVGCPKQGIVGRVNTYERPETIVSFLAPHAVHDTKIRFLKLWNCMKYMCWGWSCNVTDVKFNKGRESWESSGGGWLWVPNSAFRVKKIVYKPKIGKVLNEMKCKINLFWILSNITPNIFNSITSHLIKTFNTIPYIFIGFNTSYIFFIRWHIIIVTL